MYKKNLTIHERILFLIDNAIEKDGKYGIPLIKKQDINLDFIKLISIQDTKNNDNQNNKMKGVHFFTDDYRFESMYNNPNRSLKKLSQYKFLLTPDFSIYSDMDLWMQIENVAKNRWLGAFWQSKGLKVIPTISWGLPITYEFCFSGVEKGSIVAVSTLGCKKNPVYFMMGYEEMKKRINPSTIICFDKPFDEMKDEVIALSYVDSRFNKGDVYGW